MTNCSRKTRARKNQNKNNSSSDDKEDAKSKRVVEALENIDDDCDRNGIILVKLDNPLEAKEYGIDVIPSLVYFEVRIFQILREINFA